MNYFTYSLGCFIGGTDYLTYDDDILGCVLLYVHLYLSLSLFILYKHLNIHQGDSFWGNCIDGHPNGYFSCVMSVLGLCLLDCQT